MDLRRHDDCYEIYFDDIDRQTLNERPVEDEIDASVAPQDGIAANGGAGYNIQAAQEQRAREIELPVIVTPFLAQPNQQEIQHPPVNLPIEADAQRFNRQEIAQINTPILQPCIRLNHNSGRNAAADNEDNPED